jgi:hypothetical protein
VVVGQAQRHGQRGAGDTVFPPAGPPRADAGWRPCRRRPGARGRWAAACGTGRQRDRVHGGLAWFAERVCPGRRGSGPCMT